MYNRTNAYLHNNQRVQIEWFQFKIKNETAVVIREESTDGVSLTNSIEEAIERLLVIFHKNIVIFQDCGEEGIFKVNYEAIATTGLDKEYIVDKVNWHYFSKDLTSLELLYGKT